MSDALNDGIAALHAEAAGAMVMHVCRPMDVPSLFAAAAMGETTALWLSRAVLTALDHINHAPKKLPALCGCCPRRVGKGFAIIVALAHRDDPHSAITFAICRTCGTDVETIHQKALVALHRIWPTARAIPIEHWHEGGRA